PPEVQVDQHDLEVLLAGQAERKVERDRRLAAGSAGRGDSEPGPALFLHEPDRPGTQHVVRRRILVAGKGGDAVAKRLARRKCHLGKGGPGVNAGGPRGGHLLAHDFRSPERRATHLSRLRQCCFELFHLLRYSCRLRTTVTNGSWAVTTGFPALP